MGITVTKPTMPSLEDYVEMLQGIWKREWLTNHGPLVCELEEKISGHCGVPYNLFVTNGTLALQIAIKALNLSGEIITTPFSYVATTSSIVWENCTPVMADILPTTLTIDPRAIEAAVTDKTTAILATHVFGNACEIEAIEVIAEKYNLKIIYDAAHAFGTLYKGKSIFNYGDISTACYHATKLFQTVEGGGLFTQDVAVYKRLNLLRNFGHTSPTSFGPPGINGKNSEFHAAMGLLNLKHMKRELEKRALITQRYDENLYDTPLRRPTVTNNCQFNNAYYAVIFPSEESLLYCTQLLNDQDIFPRRYFYPSLSKLDYVKHGHTPISEDISQRVLCLPLYFALSESEVDLISGIIIKSFERK